MPTNQSQSCGSHRAARQRRAAGELRPQLVGDHEVHDHDRAAEDQVEVAGDPLRVVDRLVELVAHVDEAAGAAEAQHDERERRPPASSGCPRAAPAPSRTRPLPPRSRPAISTEATMVNTVSSVGTDTIAVIAACTNLKPAPTCGSANRWWMPIGIENDEEQHERDPPHRVAVEPAADRARHDACRRRCRPASARSRRWRAASTRRTRAPGRRRSCR